MKSFVNVSLLLCLFSLPQHLQAQRLPIPEGVGLSVRAASYGIEIHIPISVAAHWDVGLQGIGFWHDAYYNTFPELNIAVLKARYFFHRSSLDHYLAMSIGANGFETSSSGSAIDYTPVAALGYDIEKPLIGNWFGLGLDLQGQEMRGHARLIGLLANAIWVYQAIPDQNARW